MMYHEPVLLKEVLDGLAVKEDGKYLDLTLGGGGHSKEILKMLDPAAGQLVGVDQDDDALRHAGDLLSGYKNFRSIKGNFGDDDLWEALEDKSFDGILMDLGVSSHQLDDGGRGFSFRSDAEIDMRMDRGRLRTASEAVNGMDVKSLADIIYQYGEERRSRKIAARIADSRPVKTTGELADIVRSCFSARERRESRIDPATRTFQALRIWVNDELEKLERGLLGAAGSLKSGGRLVVISYHSLEYRIVKSFIAREVRDCLCPPEFPVCVCGHKASLKKITRKVVTAGEREQKENPRSRSAKLRIAERL